MPQLFEPCSDPIIRLRRQRCVLSAANIALFSVLAVWALWPLPKADMRARLAALSMDDTTNAGEEDRSTQDSTPPQIDPQPFTLARLWNPLPPQPPESTDDRTEETRLVKRPELQLIGIIEDRGERCAAIYHVDRKALLIVRSGDRIDPFIVATITDETVRLEDGRFIASFSVRRERR